MVNKSDFELRRKLEILREKWPNEFSIELWSAFFFRMRANDNYGVSDRDVMIVSCVIAEELDKLLE